MNPSDDFDALLNRYLDGTATGKDVASLDEMLRTSPAVRRDYAEAMSSRRATVILLALTTIPSGAPRPVARLRPGATVPPARWVRRADTFADTPGENGR